MKEYDFREIESRLQKKWEEEKPYKTGEDYSKEKVFVLGMFPYPSGEGLHVGHARIFTASDIYARAKRMQGYNVLFPTGWDAFGLPAEQFALKNKIHPRISTDKNVNNFRRQMKMLGLSYDFDREVDTTDPNFYTWSQWVFLKLYEKGLAFESYDPINWCPSCQTGLANEDLEGGKCERCGSVVEKKKMRQWTLRITEYAERLLTDLNILEKWPEWLKALQRNWIGKSEGTEFNFPITHKRYEGDVVFASNNKGKLTRMQNLIKELKLPITLKTPIEVGVNDFDVTEDGETLKENAEKKVKALIGKTNLPILADDSGFFIKGEKIDPVTVKRNALNGDDERNFTIEEIGNKMLVYYQNIATNHGGQVDAEWHNVLCLNMNGSIAHVETIRPVVLTNTPKGTMDPYFPLRPLYISKSTNKYVLEHTQDEEIVELQPIIDGIKKLFTPSITIFTTRADTLFGVTFVAISVELASSWITNGWSPVSEVKAYITKTLEEQKEILDYGVEKEKTGIATGIFAINPATNEKIPVWIANYVLGGVGTGAIMAVPAHDERDFEFAKKYNLPLKTVISPETGTPQENPEQNKRIVVILWNRKDNTFLSVNWGKEMGGTLFIGGGVDDSEERLTCAIREMKEETGYIHVKHLATTIPIHHNYFAHSKNVARRIEATGFLFELIDNEKTEVSLEKNEKNKFTLEWLSGKEIERVLEDELHALVYKQLIKSEVYVGDGTLIESSVFDGLENDKAKEKITEKFGGKKVTRYKLQDWVFSRQRYWGEPISMVHDEMGKSWPLDVTELPLVLPEVEHYEPTGTGESPLANITDWVNVQGIITEQGTFKQDVSGKLFKRETNTMPQWAGSSWYYLRFADPNNTKELISKEKEKYWQPVDRYVGGAEHATRHLIYARFWHKFLYDIGVVTHLEPFLTMESVGLVLGPDGQKMSKRSGNVINPDDVVKEWGADTVRLYTAFMGSFYDATPWNEKAIVGCSRFLERVSRAESFVQDRDVEKLDSLLHKTIKKVTEDIEAFKFNTAISSLMIFLNKVEEHKILGKYQWNTFIQLLAPFAPFLAEELWVRGNNLINFHTDMWPKYDIAKTVDSEVTMPLQVNGKLRGTFIVANNASDEEVQTVVLGTQEYKKYVGDVKPKKVIIIKNRLINIVI